MEDKVFERYSCNFDSLVPFGFSKTKDGFKYGKHFKKLNFSAEIFVDNSGKVSGKVFDLDMNEEFLPLRTSGGGAFLDSVRNEYKEILEEIRDNCFSKEYFISPQANRISKRIFEDFEDEPDFPFKKFPTYGVFRIKTTRKWYGLIMTVEANKVLQNGDDSIVEIMNIGVGKEMSPSFQQIDGVYPGYHMNKQSWITVVLNDSLDDEVIMALIDAGRNNILENTTKAKGLRLKDLQG